MRCKRPFVTSQREVELGPPRIMSFNQIGQLRGDQAELVQFSDCIHQTDHRGTSKTSFTLAFHVLGQRLQVGVRAAAGDQSHSGASQDSQRLCECCRSLFERTNPVVGRLTDLLHQSSRACAKRQGLSARGSIRSCQGRAPVRLGRSTTIAGVDANPRGLATALALSKRSPSATVRLELLDSSLPTPRAHSSKKTRSVHRTRVFPARHPLKRCSSAICLERRTVTYLAFGSDPSTSGTSRHL